jgi:hypothetical protein
MKNCEIGHLEYVASGGDVPLSKIQFPTSKMGMTGFDREILSSETATTGCASPVRSGVQKLFGNFVSKLKASVGSLFTSPQFAPAFA